MRVVEGEHAAPKHAGQNTPPKRATGERTHGSLAARNNRLGTRFSRASHGKLAARNALRTRTHFSPLCSHRRSHLCMGRLPPLLTRVYGQKQLSFPVTVSISAAAGAAASFITSPLDLAKLRMQVSRASERSCEGEGRAMHAVPDNNGRRRTIGPDRATSGPKCATSAAKVAQNALRAAQNVP